MNSIEQLREALQAADAVVIGAGAGLSVSAGYTYSGERFNRHFADFIVKYGFGDEYSASFYNFPTQEEFWAFWSRIIYYERYAPIPKPQVFKDLLRIVADKDYFVITTNADHLFQRTGFDKQRLFYTQGDYGLWQCRKPCHQQTYDNESQVMQMFHEQSDMRIPSELIPRCPVCGGEMYPNLRGGSWFVQDEGWYAAADRYQAFMDSHTKGKVVYLDLGTGGNTPAIIKYPFMQRTFANSDATYVSINFGEAYAPLVIRRRSICINNDIATVLSDI